MINWLKKKAIDIWRWLVKPLPSKYQPDLEDKGAAVILPLLNRPNQYIFYCPGCQDNHTVYAGPGGHVLTGPRSKPTIKPSVLSEPDEDDNITPLCHSWVTNGKIRFLYDCTHKLAGKTVDLPPL